MPRACTPPLSFASAERIRQAVYEAAAEHEVPPAFIVAHIHYPAVHAARLKVWRVLIVEWGYSRQRVAKMFYRSNRRLRKSVLGF